MTEKQRFDELVEEFNGPEPVDWDDDTALQIMKIARLDRIAESLEILADCVQKKGRKK